MATELAFEFEDQMIAKQAIIKFLYQELLPGAGVRKMPEADENLLESGVLDSLGIMKLLEYLERAFSIRISEEDLLPDNFQSINAITLLVQKYQGNARDFHG